MLICKLVFVLGVFVCAGYVSCGSCGVMDWECIELGLELLVTWCHNVIWLFRASLASALTVSNCCCAGVGFLGFQ